MEQYLIENYYDEIVILLNDTNDRTYGSLQVDLIHLQQHKFDWFQKLLNDVHNELPKWNAALFCAQKAIASKDEGFLEIGYQIKVNCYVHLVHVPPPDPHFKLPFPNHDQIGLFREVKGTVVRMSQAKCLEVKRDFICSKCSTIVTLDADYSLMYQFDIPKNCTKVDCKGNLHQKQLRPPPQYCVQYQELRIQEALSDKNIPPTITVSLESDLVDSCQPGDCVTICGTIERRWISFQQDGRCEAVIVMRAVSLIREQNSLAINSVNLSEKMMTLKADWIEQLQKHGELGIRDLILKSICPDVYGMYPVKLAIALAICSGNEISNIKSTDQDDLHHRGQSHILLIGDPGLAKSKLLLSAVQIAPRAVHTTGMGCSSAGLTAAAVKEDGEWVLEAGALVLADGGICCIDEFNMMRESDKSSIHEAMEQQTISMAKAGIVCKLNTRCAIIAAANPKNLSAMSEADGTSSINIGIASPLLSRFDLVFILRDERIPEWDDAIADHLLAQAMTGFQGFSVDKNSELWSQQKLQSHFDAISRIHPKMTPLASELLRAYYRKCRLDPEREYSRTTIRLLDSLNRLAEAHARLVFRDEITVVDAIVTIRLMESTFGFGHFVKPYDVIKEELPLGPDEDEIHHILNIFDMDSKKNQRPIDQNPSPSLASTSSASPSKKSPENQPERSQISTKIHKDIEKSTTDQAKVQSVNLVKTQPPRLIPSISNQSSNVQPTIDMDLDEIDDILSFEIDNKEGTVNAQPTPSLQMKTNENEGKEDVMSDDGDLACSQALDDIELSQLLTVESTVEPEPKIPKIDAQPFKRPQNRLTLNPIKLKLNKFSFVPSTKRSVVINSVPSTSTANANENKPIESNSTNQPVDKPIMKKNPIFCTPSDDESSQEAAAQNEPAKKLSFKLKLNPSKIFSQRPILQQQNVNDSKDSEKSENDSAYDSMQSSSGSLCGSFGSAAKTGKTPAIFTPGGVTFCDNSELDLSCLDTLEF